jgi:uncharacterized BrkB/YihY/UPF0761 family membrane protein
MLTLSFSAFRILEEASSHFLFASVCSWIAIYIIVLFFSSTIDHDCENVSLLWLLGFIPLILLFVFAFGLLYYLRTAWFGPFDLA